MMFASTNEKTNHQTRPNARPERSARLSVILLSLWNAPKRSPNDPPSTMSKKKPENLLMVGSAIVIPNQCNASGQCAPRRPIRHKVEYGQHQARQNTCQQTPSNIHHTPLLDNSGEPARESSNTVITRRCLQTRGKPLINAQASSCWNGSESQTQQHQHAVRPVPIRVTQPEVQLSSQDNTKNRSETVENAEHQRHSYCQFCNPDACS